MVKRYAFSLIELIIAIVIIGFVVLSLPTIININHKSIDSNLVQEAIFAASAELNQVLTYYWDENSADINSTAGVINLAGDCNSTTHLRPGHIDQEKHRKCNSATDIYANSPIGTDIPNFSLEDTIHQSTSIYSSSSTTIASKDGYKKTYNSSVGVAIESAGIKKITVTIDDASGNTITSLSAYACNIGEVDFYHKSY